jgi:predicted nucleotide-binding protein
LNVPYHVRITSRDPQRRSHDALALDKDADWIEEHVVAPRREGRDIFIDGRVFSWDSIDQILISETDQTSDQLLPQIHARRRSKPGVMWISDRWYVASDGREVTEQFISGPPGTGPRPDPRPATTFAGNRKAVIVIYGHDKQANDALFAWLRAIGLQPREWNQLVRASGSASPFIGEVLDQALRDVQAVVAFFTPDEYVTAAVAGGHGRPRFQARPNVLIEAGMALITHPKRTIIAVVGDQELPSDLAGRHYVRLSHTDVAPLHDLAQRLADAGCDVDQTGSDWLNPGRFPDRDNTTPPAAGRPASQTQAGTTAGLATRHDRTNDHDAANLASTPDVSTKPAGERHDASAETQQREAAQRATQDTEARQVVVRIEAKSGERFTHLITVSTPITYLIKQVQVQIVWQTNSGGLAMTSTGFGGDPSHTDGQCRYYTFRASVNPQISPEPAIRFVDLHSNLYYQFRDHTQRFPANTDWPHALTDIDDWLRSGPSA